MDPDATLSLIIDFAVEGNYREMVEYTDDLWSWLAGGGLPPKDPRKTEYDRGFGKGYHQCFTEFQKYGH